MDERVTSTAAAADAWEALQSALVSVRERLGQQGECIEAELLLERVASAHRALHKLEHALQGNHLACCIFPRVQTPGEVAVALGRLSAERTGALIAFELEDSLDDYVASGTLVDAQLSAGLLESLFYPGNPLHDGAVIVRSSRILAAGVFLPVAAEHRDPVHGRLLGARHRAALGLSRLTDALLFVVSEETGAISLAAKGALLHPVNVHALLPASAADRETSQVPTAGATLARIGTWVARLWRAGSGGKTG